MPESPITFRVAAAVEQAYRDAATKAGVPLGRWIQDAATASLPAGIRKRLPKPRSPGRPPKPPEQEQ